MKSVSEALAGAFSSHALIPATSTDSALSSRYARRVSNRIARATADHRAALSRALAYQLGRVRTPEEAARLEAEYEQRMAQGPDLLRIRRKSAFMDAPPHGLTREQLAKLRFAFNSMARGSWRQRQEGRHRGIISRTGKDVMGALIYLAERYPRLFPSLERLASLAQCCKQSVVTALRCLEGLGFITRHRRLQRVAGLLGIDCAQATNAYELHLPGHGMGALALSLFGPEPESKSWAAIGSVSSSYFRIPAATARSPGIAQGDAYGDPPKAGRF